MNGLDLLKICKEYPEPVLDPFYSKIDKSLIISMEPRRPNPLQIANNKLRKIVSFLEVKGRANWNDEEAQDKIKQLISLLEVDNMNFSELSCFFAVNDMSYSQFFQLEEEERYEFIVKILDQYIRHRHNIYEAYGYSDTALQVQADSFSHKSSGPQAQEKIETILAEYGIRPLDPCATELDVFEKETFCYICPDGVHKELFQMFLRRKIQVNSLPWSESHEGKMPDFLIKIGGELFIGECKHIKESGGGQDKQINELISLIKDEAPDRFHYVSYLDGIYFNKLICKQLRKNAKKIRKQRAGVLCALRRNPTNYFVNTYGFHHLIRSYINMLV